MPEGISSSADLFDHFGLDPHIWCGPKANIYTYPAFDRVVVGETDEMVTYVNPLGITCTEYKKDAYKSMPHFEAFPVASRSDWEDYKRRLQWHPARVGAAWAEHKEQLRASTAPVILFLSRTGSLYGSLRDMVGMAEVSMLFYDDPGMVRDMMDTVTELCLQSIDALFTDYVPDAVCLWEDMAYKTAPLVSPAIVEEFMVPRYRKITARLRARQVPYILLDSDGYCDELIPLWLDAGVDGLVPMERQCGMHPDVYREKYPRLLMCGGIDKRALASGRRAIDEEIAMVRRTIASGGFVPWFDHGLPHDVAWDDFVYFVERLKELRG
jgi:uroporphyrinogen decarboxylase